LDRQAALGLIVAVAGLSVFYIAVGLPGSYASMSEQRSRGTNASKQRKSGTYLVQDVVAVIPYWRGFTVGLVKTGFN
jgi:hypothetical protein